MLKKTFIFTILLTLAFAACSSRSQMSPSDTFRAFLESKKSKDVNKMKSLLTKESLEFFEEVAKDSGMSLDESLRADNKNMPFEGDTEIRNEMIEGNEATIEIKVKNGSWVPLDFTKEDEQWKFDPAKPWKKAEEMFKQADEFYGDTDESPEESDKK